MTPLTRSEGLRLLQAATPKLGRWYGEHRNYAAEADGATTTSVLSPYVRRRILLEQELVSAAVQAHGARAAERFIEEVFWRTYFKGHLETRPSIWVDYLRQVDGGREQLEANDGLRTTYAQAVEGCTGIDGFDDWSRDLVRKGWLHNHVRMWFASIWIFTLRLPWALGADFFLRHLLDGDPASNTLSWRWVAGLHTRGRAYAARADNIARYTHGRYRPLGLNEAPQSLEETVEHPLVALQPTARLPEGPIALLLHEDDLHPESLNLSRAQVARVGIMKAHAVDADAAVAAAHDQALYDASARACAVYGTAPALDAADVDWARGLPVISAWAPVGVVADALPHDILRVRREWDEQAWPLCAGGYFKVRKAIPRLLELAGVVDEEPNRLGRSARPEDSET